MQYSQHKICSVFLFSSAFIGILFAVTPNASADILWNWDYSCSILYTQTKCKGGSGTFVTTDQQGHGGDIYFVVTGMTGTVEGNTITSLLPPNSLGWDNDNKLDAPSGSLYGYSKYVVTGIGFLTNNDPPTHENVNLAYALYLDYALGFADQIMGPGFNALLNVDFNDEQVGIIGETPVPEPSSLLVCATMIGLLLGGTLRKTLKQRNKGLYAE